MPIGRIEMVRKDNPTLRLVERKEQEQTVIAKQEAEETKQQEQISTTTAQQEESKETEALEAQTQESKQIYREVKTSSFKETVKGFGVPSASYEWYAKISTHSQYIFDRDFLKEIKAISTLIMLNREIL